MLAKKILVVDDNVEAAVTTATLLSMLGNEARTAHDGVAAVMAAADFRPDAILMDIAMPRMDGHDATRRIRQEDWGRDTVIVALSAWGSPDYREKSRRAGCDGHLTKPVALDDLESMLDRLLP